MKVKFEEYGKNDGKKVIKKSCCREGYIASLPPDFSSVGVISQKCG